MSEKNQMPIVLKAPGVNKLEEVKLVPKRPSHLNIISKIRPALKKHKPKAK